MRKGSAQGFAQREYSPNCIGDNVTDFVASR